MGKEYVTAVLQLPDDEVARGALLEVLRGDAYFHGAPVTAVYLGNAITENEVFERAMKPMVVKTLRDDVAQRHAREGLTS